MKKKTEEKNEENEVSNIEKEQCGICRYYRRGMCRYSPPTRMLTIYPTNRLLSANSNWPEVNFDDWCGKFERE